MEYEQEAVVNFLVASKPQLIAMVELAYQQVGGHYTAIPPGERQQAAAGDVEELIVDLTQGTAHLPVLPSPAIVADVIQMVSVLEMLFVGYIQATLDVQPELRRELIRRMQLSTNRFRMKLTMQHLGAVQQALAPPRSDGSGPAT